MKIIYAVALDKEAYPPGTADTTQVSALAGRIETSVHTWMRENHPDVMVETKRVSDKDDQAARHQVLADTQEEMERGQQILKGLEDFLRDRSRR